MKIESPTLDDLIGALKQDAVQWITPLLPNGEPVPAHFHVTEVARIQKDFIDCGGTVRKSLRGQLQLLVASDFEHRLAPEKLLKILDASTSILGDEPLPLYVEHGNAFAVSYAVSDLEVRGSALILQLEAPVTACLAPDTCGLELTEARTQMVRITAPPSACAPGSGCC